MPARASARMQATNFCKPENLVTPHPPPHPPTHTGTVQVSASGIHAGLESLVAGGAPPKLLIIDDGWQRTDVDPHFRLAAAAPGSIDSGVAVAEAAQEEAIEAAAALLSGPDDNLGETLHASHQLEAEDRKQADQAAMEGAEGAGGGGGSGQRSDDQPGQQQQQQKQQQETGQAGQAGGASAGSGRTWAQAAWAVVAHLETAFFNACRRRKEGREGSVDCGVG